MRMLLIALFVGLITATGFAEEVANPIYEAWAACKPGSSVTIKMTNKMGGPERSMTQEEKLVEVTPQQVVVSVTTSIVLNGKTMTLPASNQTIPAKVEKDLAGTSLQLRALKPKVSGLKASSEPVQVKGTKVQATKYEYSVEATQDGEHISAKVKCWISKEVPGGLVKEESEMEKPAKGSGTREVTDYKKVAK